MELNQALARSTFYVIHGYYITGKVTYHCLPLETFEGIWQIQSNCLY